MTEQGARGFKCKEGRLRLDISKQFFYCEVGGTQGQVAQSDCGVGSVQGQVEWRFELPGLVEDILGHGRGFGIDHH